MACEHKSNYKSPEGYDFAKPEKHHLPERLHEISGIAFLQGNAKIFYAVNDEEGKVYYFDLTSNSFPFTKFSGKGDYEDLAIINNNRIVVLKSDGTLYVFAADVVGKKEIDTVEEFAQILPKGEYEGIAAQENNLFVLCKKCPTDKKNKQVTLYEIVLMNGAIPRINNTHIIDLSSVETEKQNFYPSCIAKNPISGDWYILSSVNKKLIVLNRAWILKNAYSLDPAIFRQPEGMTFSSNGDLYISNEGGERAATILKFTRKGLNAGY
jgi:uncharacterized protein YjiK